MPIKTGAKIEYLSPPMQVSMGDHWFEIAQLTHFWIRRRFDVLLSLSGAISWKQMEVSEIGCGNGLLQRQCEEQLGINVDGFDLNEFALQQNISETSRIFCYNIDEKLPQFRHKYDIIFLFDVIEHIEDDASFLKSALFHLKEQGKLIINVPANNNLLSAYDTAAGHVRRYDANSMRVALDQAGMEIDAWSYWGLPLYPLLLVRKWLLKKETDREKILKNGFKPPSAAGNQLLWLASKLEIIPQHFVGSSLMVVAKPR